MATLENCPACQKEKSSAARTCPHCGHPSRARLRSWLKRAGGLALLLTALAATNLHEGLHVVLDGLHDAIHERLPDMPDTPPSHDH